jgi:hypothetical protein
MNRRFVNLLIIMANAAPGMWDKPEIYARAQAEAIGLAAR